jgi:hypothetical protein
MSLIHNEQTKLTATYLNGLAIAVAAIGGLQPLVSEMPWGSSTVFRILICLMISLLLHLLALATLTGLKS